MDAATIPVRRVRFDHDLERRRRHFMDGDLVMSHVLAVLSSSFPHGEEFFVRSVRRFRDDIDDPALARAVTGFIGQEAIHGREHERLNQRLAELGYPTMAIDRLIDITLRLRERITSPRACLALTAALEHFTSTMAAALLDHDDAPGQVADDEIRALLCWHALEESEHKAVAFDVYRAVGGGEVLRIFTFWLTVVLGGISLVGATAVSVARDRSSRNLRRLVASLRRLPRWPFLRPSVRRRFIDYSRRGFHPDDHDDSEMLTRWRQRLFGPDGELRDRLPAAG